MKINIICVGKLKEKFFAEACNEYLKRLSPFYDVTVTELNEATQKGDGDALIEKELAVEGESIKKQLTKQSYKIAMCIEGKTVSSTDLAGKIAKIGLDGYGCIDLIIGGSNGISDEIKKICDWRLSMSPMTFPHHLARVMVLEQLYRAAMINSNSKYHK